MEQAPAKSSTEEEEQVESIVMDSAQMKEDSEVNETRIIQMLRERTSDEIGRIIQGSTNWCTKMLERLHQNAMQKMEAGKDRKKAEDA